MPVDNHPRLDLVMAHDLNYLLGWGYDDLPWHLPDDLRFFQRVTQGYPVLMGRKTFQALGKPLPKRRNVVITHNTSWQAEGVEVVHSLAEALQLLSHQKIVKVIGGGQIYAQCLPYAQRIYATKIATKISAPPNHAAYMPVYSSQQWRQRWCYDHPADSQHAWPFTFQLWQRRG